MTEEEFYNIQCGDKIFDTNFKETGTVMVSSRGEVYIKFPHNPNNLYCYDINEESNCCECIIKQ